LFNYWFPLETNMTGRARGTDWCLSGHEDETDVDEETHVSQLIQLPVEVSS